MTILEMQIWKWPIQKWKSRNWKFGMALLGHRTQFINLWSPKGINTICKGKGSCEDCFLFGLPCYGYLPVCLLRSGLQSCKSACMRFPRGSTGSVKSTTNWTVSPFLRVKVFTHRPSRIIYPFHLNLRVLGELERVIGCFLRLILLHLLQSSLLSPGSDN
jgi:hypothetical protein